MEHCPKPVSSPPPWGDRLSGLSALLAVAEKRSFTAAAADLGVTPSAVSQIVRALEERVGMRLLQRTTRSVGLTEVGARLVARLKPALGAVEDAFESIGELRDKPAGRLRLTLPRVGYEQVLAPRLAAFLEAYPDIDLDISPDEGLEDIVGSGFDAGIRLGEMVEREMVGIRVSPDLRAAVMGSPSYFLARKKPEHPRELQTHECINYRWRTMGNVYRWEFTERGRDFEIAVNGRVVVNDAHVMVHAALAGWAWPTCSRAPIATILPRGVWCELRSPHSPQVRTDTFLRGPVRHIG